MGILYQLFGWIIRNLYSVTGIYWLSIILMTIIFNLMMLPLTLKQQRSTEGMQKIQPEINALQKKYKNDKEMLNKKIMEIYSANNVNPLSGCLPLLIQFPIIISLFTVLRNPLEHIFMGDEQLTRAALEQGFLWINDLSLPDQLSNVLSFSFANSIPGILPIITAVLTYLQFELTMPKAQPDQPQASTMTTMKVFMPLMILMFSQQMAAGLVLYWATGTVFRIIQSKILNKQKEARNLEQ